MDQMIMLVDPKTGEEVAKTAYTFVELKERQAHSLKRLHGKEAAYTLEGLKAAQKTITKLIDFAEKHPNLEWRVG